MSKYLLYALLMTMFLLVVWLPSWVSQIVISVWTLGIIILCLYLWRRERSSASSSTDESSSAPAGYQRRTWF